MRRLEVSYRPAASTDLRNVYLWVLEASGDPETARRFTERIREACEKIGGRPLAGRARDDLAPGLRTFPFERRGVIAYFVEGDEVQVSNVFYGGREYEALFAEASREARLPDENE